jgi:transcriptional regulator with XRE-family HTH domain
MNPDDDYRVELAQYLLGFGANARRLRNTNRPGFSQEELACRARLHRTEVGKIEQGDVEPKLTTLVLIRGTRCTERQLGSRWAAATAIIEYGHWIRPVRSANSRFARAIDNSAEKTCTLKPIPAI